MERFHYKAKRGLQEVVDDFIEADTREDALDLLAGRGLFPLLIEKSGASAPAGAAGIRVPAAAFIWSSKKLGSRDRVLFTRKLATLIHARVELLSALKILHEQADEPRLKKLVAALFAAIKEGRSFSDALQQFEGFFDPFYISMIKAGESSGRLDLALEQLSAFLEKAERLKARVITALAYPALLVCVGCISIVVLFTFVIPKLSPVLKGMGAQLPVITRVVIGISEFSHSHSSLLFACIAALAAGTVALRRNKRFLRAFGALVNSFPVVRELVRNQGLVNFSWALSLLIRSGIPVYQSLRVAARTVRDDDVALRMQNVCERLRNGESLSRSMEQQAALPAFFIKMLAIGEESGRLPEVLQQISDSYAQEVEMSIAMISSLLEPFLILALGSVLGLIVFSLMLPLFEITQMIR